MNIDSFINTFGNSVFLTAPDGWKSCVYNAFIQPIRYKTKLYMMGDFTPLGANKNTVCLYLGPAAHDLTKLTYAHRIHDSDGNKYKIDRAEKIRVGNKAVYIWAIIRQTAEGDI